MGIRYDTELQKSIRRTVKNFNAKVDRLESKGLTAPSRITSADIKAGVTTRRRLLSELKSYQSFSARGAEKPVLYDDFQITSFELSRIKREQRRVKSALTRQIHQMEQTNVKLMGVQLPNTLAERDYETYQQLKARRAELDINFTSKDTYESYMNKLERNTKRIDRRDDMLFSNYITDLTDIAYWVGYDPDKLEYITTKLSQLNQSQLVDLVKTEQAIRIVFEHYGRKRDDNIADNDVVDALDTLYESIDTIIKDYL